MDFPKSVPNIGLVGGRFVDENTGTGVPGSLIPSVWGNSVTLEILSVLAAAGVVPDELKTNQLVEAIGKLVTAGSAWSKITGKPTTLGGYGITDAVSSTGNAASASKLAAARTISLTGAASGSGSFDGSTNVSISVTLSDSGIAAGSYAKVTVNAKGIVTGSASLVAGDIPSLDWNKIATGKPTTLGGYGITNGLTSGNNDAVPSFYNAAPAAGGSASINLREVGLGTSTQLAPEYAPCIGFLWSSVVYGRMSMRSDGQPYWNGSPMLTNSNIDPWAMQPVGALIALLDNNSVPAPPRDNPAYRYIRLTASDPYNTGIVTSESVAGVAPLVIASGVVSLAGSPFNNLTVSLINTERRHIRAGLPGVVEQDAGQGHTHKVMTGTGAGTGLGSGTSTGGGNIVNDIVPPGGQVTGMASDGSNGVVRVANETRVKSMGATYYMRIR